MNTAKTLTPDLVAKIREKGIDFSDIPELTEDQMKNFYPKNWKPLKTPVTVRVDSDILHWLKGSNAKGYQKRMNDALRWAMVHGFPFV